MVDEAAVAELYERYGPALYKRCLNLVGSEADAHELLQEVFCQFWRNRSTFQHRSSPFTFLYRIATNLSIDWYRRRQRRGGHYDFDESRDGADSETQTERIVKLNELAALTEGMEPAILTVAVLYHVDGMTQEEIAAALSVSRRTVGKRLKQFLAYTDKRRRKLQSEESLQTQRQRVDWDAP